MRVQVLYRVICAIVLLLPTLTYAESRVALVIGNQTYQNTTHLANPANDARAVAKKLTTIGFDVMLRLDLTGQEFRVALGEFTDKAINSDVAMVFYAGHGIEMNGENFLIPIDASMRTEASAQFETISLDGMLSTVRQSGKLGMVLLDACRDNPFVNTMKRKNGTRSVSRGLANVSVESESGMLVSFAAQAGDTADDGSGMHSPYTTALLDVLDQPGLEIGRMFRRVRANVKAQTGGRQVPIERMQLPDEEIYLVPGNGSQTQTLIAPSTYTEDPLLVFLAALKTGNSASLEDFIGRYPNHPKANDARRILQDYAEDDFWKSTVNEDTIGAYQRYTMAFPKGKYLNNANSSLARLTEPEVKDYLYKVIIADPTDGWLNLRSGASSKTNIIQRMDNGLEVDVLREDGKWAEVRLPNGVRGWAFRKYMKR